MQQYGGKYFVPRTPSLTLGVGSKGQNITCSEHGYVAYQIKGNHECSNMVANILPHDPIPLIPDPGYEVKKSNSSFSEHGDVAYQIKWNHGCSNMINILPIDPPPPHPGGQKVKIQLLQNKVMLQLKLKGITNASTW